jgi:hypothetical protein
MVSIPTIISRKKLGGTQKQQQYYSSKSTTDNNSHHSPKAMDPQRPPPTLKTKRGLSQWKREIWGGLVFLSIVYAVAYYTAVQIAQTPPATMTTSSVVRLLLLPHHLAIFLRPDSSFCSSNTTTQVPDNDQPPSAVVRSCTRPDLFAFQITAAIMQVFMAYHGLVYWHLYPRRHDKKTNTTPEQRLFGKIPVAERLNVGILVFQTWDFVFSLFIPEHASPVFLAHHILTGATAYASLQYQLVHYYALYFGGCCEISSIFLVVCDYNLYFPVSAQHPAGWKLFVGVCQVAFVLTFVGYRILGWWYYSIQLWSDVQQVPKKQRNSRSSSIVAPTRLLNAFLTMDLVLGALQVHWFVFGMIPKIQEIFGNS